MSENQMTVKVGIVSAKDGLINVVNSESNSPPLLGAKAASGAKNAPAEDVTVAESGASIKEFPVEEPAPAGIDKNLTPIGRVDPNGFAALLGTDADEEDLAGVGSAGKASVDDAPPSSTTPSTRSGLRVGKLCSTKLLCGFLTVVVILGCSAVALSSYGSGGVSEFLESVFVPDAAAVDPMPEPNSGLLFASPDRHPTFAPRPTPPVSNPVDDPNWLVAASGFCSDLSSTPVAGVASIDFKFHPEVSVAFTDAPFHQAASLEDGIEIRGEEYSQTDVLAAGTWTNKNIALLEPTSSCDDPPAGSQDEWAVSVFMVTGNEACGDECVHFSGLVSGASDNFVARKEGRFLCQLFVESHTFSDQARRSLRRRLSPTPLMSSMKPTARQPAFAPVPDIDLTASWLVAAAGICSDLSVTPNLQHVAAESAADQSGTFIADIKFQFHPETSVAYTMSPDRGAVEIGDDGVVVGDKAYTAVDVLTAAVWDLKNIALLEPTSSCGDPPAGSQDEWAISVFKVNTNDKCGAECVLYSGRVSSSSLDSFVQKKGRFPCQLYVDSKCSGVPKDTRCNKDKECAAKFPDKPICQTRGCNYCTAGKQGDKCWADSECAQGFQCKDETCKAWDTCTAKGDSIVIAHGANLKETVDWSLNQGANGIEMDIHFDTYTGQPTEFHHGAPCDCTFSEPGGGGGGGGGGRGGGGGGVGNLVA